MAEISIDERLAALENQSYVMYLQLNAVTKILIDKEVIDKDTITKEMDELNNHLFEITKELQEKDAGDPSLAEVAAAQPAE
jgi:uncharacterized membrane protein YukC